MLLLKLSMLVSIMNDAYYYALAATHKKKKKKHKSTDWMSPPHVSRKHRHVADKRATQKLHHDLQSFNKSIAHNPNVTDLRIHRGKKNIVHHPLGIDPHTVALVNQRNKELEEQQHLLSRQHIAAPEHLNVGVKAKLGPGAGPLLTQPHVYHPHDSSVDMDQRAADQQQRAAEQAARQYIKENPGSGEYDTGQGMPSGVMSGQMDTPLPLNKWKPGPGEHITTELGEPSGVSTRLPGHPGYDPSGDFHSYFSKDSSGIFLIGVTALLLIGGYYVFIEKK